MGVEYVHSQAADKYVSRLHNWSLLSMEELSGIVLPGLCAVYATKCGRGCL